MEDEDPHRAAPEHSGESANHRPAERPAEGEWLGDARTSTQDEAERSMMDIAESAEQILCRRFSSATSAPRKTQPKTKKSPPTAPRKPDPRSDVGVAGSPFFRRSGGAAGGRRPTRSPAPNRRRAEHGRRTAAPSDRFDALPWVSRRWKPNCEPKAIQQVGTVKTRRSCHQQPAPAKASSPGRSAAAGHRHYRAREAGRRVGFSTGPSSVGAQPRVVTLATPCHVGLPRAAGVPWGEGSLHSRA